MNLLVFGEILEEFVRRLNFGSNSNLPSAPSTLEMSPIYPEIEKYGKETETWTQNEKLRAQNKVKVDLLLGYLYAIVLDLSIKEIITVHYY